MERLEGKKAGREFMEFETLTGHLINAVYEDAGAHRSIKGRVTSVDNDFLTIETYGNIFHIRKTAIISIKEYQGENR